MPVGDAPRLAGAQGRAALPHPLSKLGKRTTETDHDTAYVFRQSVLPRCVTGVLQASVLQTEGEQAVHLHRQLFTRDTKNVYITLDPPYLALLPPYPAHPYLHVSMGCLHGVAWLGKVDRMRPRWDRVHRAAGKLHAITVNDGKDMCFRLHRKMVIPLGQSMGREVGAFQRYATTCLEHFDAQAAKIQQAWRRAISDPSYLVCRRRLLAEWNEWGPER